MRERNKIIFDLDGTILDARRRLYVLFRDLTGSDLTLDEYWRLKRQKTSNQTILQNDLLWPTWRVDQFVQIWLDRIEQEHYLNMDTVYSDVPDVLSSLRNKGFDLIIATNRQDKDRTQDQLENLGVLSFFSTVLVTEHKVNKTEMINAQLEAEKIHMIVGDTGEDVRTGQNLKLFTVAITRGFRNREVLSGYGPDMIIDDFKPLIDLSL